MAEVLTKISRQGLELLTDVEIAELLKISRRQTWKLLAMGRLPEPIRLGGSRSVRWRADDIHRWIANGCRAEAAKAVKP